MRKPSDETSLRAVEWQRFLRGPDAHLLEQLYVPALSKAVRYDRCCAYFSSRVLAVAARGFGGFIQNLLDMPESAPKPAARLLVNEQLDPEDLDALLATGNQQPLIEKLLKQFKTPKEALEKNRLAMLAWLVKSGWLEVRVGLMRRTRGILHAKFGIVTDKHGDYIAFFGSDNETGQSLIENYEELQVGPSWQDQGFAQYYRDRFQTLWEDRDESVTVLPLPEAVRLKLITLAPVEPPRELRHDKDHLATAMLWRYLASAPYLPNGEQACDATAMVDLWPHQRRVVEDTAAAFPKGKLLCDEVGMGKTIEAIMVLRRLLCGRGVKRALLLVPAGLLVQWQDELREKGGLLVPRWEDGYLRFPDGTRRKMEAADALAGEDVLLLSREWARLEGNRNVVLTAPVWDLVLLDEAHAARRSQPDERQFNSGNLLLQLLREFQLRRRARGIMLLSATPMQTQPWEPWDLLAVLGVGGEWMVEFNDIRTYYNSIAALRRGKLGIPEARVVAPLVAGDEEFPPPPDGLLSTNPNGLAKSLAFCPPGKREKYAMWLREGAPLGRRMHRNTRETLKEYHARGLSDYEPPRRIVRDEVFDYQDQAERDCYEAIKQYIDARYERLEQEKKGKGFVMTVYRRRAASSPHALQCSLQRRLEALEAIIQQRALAAPWLSLVEEQIDPRDLSDADIDEHIDMGLPKQPTAAKAEKDEIQALLRRLGQLGNRDSKFDTFWGLLQKLTADGRSVLVFTEYTDTMDYIREQIRPWYGTALGCYSGRGGSIWDGQKWLPVSKADITDRLSNGQLKVLVCTDAASEGLNLQAASALINYDLPWNPSKVEQRIGRIDRIGQQHATLPIHNLFLANSVDMKVYQALHHRCGLFKHFVGPMQPVLAKARDILRYSLHSDDPETLLGILEATADEVEQDVVVAGTFEKSAATALPPMAPPATRRDLEMALARLADSHGTVRARRPAKKGNVWRLSGLGKRAIEVTTDREALERHRHLLPLTTGAPIVERLAKRLTLSGSVPLVIAEATAGRYRCAEARWVNADGQELPVTSVGELDKLLASWDGSIGPEESRRRRPCGGNATSEADGRGRRGGGKGRPAKATRGCPFPAASGVRSDAALFRPR